MSTAGVVALQRPWPTPPRRIPWEPFQRITVAAASRAVADEAAVLGDVHVRHLGGQRARGAAGQKVELGRHAFAAAQKAPRPIPMAFAFDRGAAIAEEGELAH